MILYSLAPVPRVFTKNKKIFNVYLINTTVPFLLMIRCW